jgi:hypothetical protein
MTDLQFLNSGYSKEKSFSAVVACAYKNKDLVILFIAKILSDFFTILVSNTGMKLIRIIGVWKNLNG